MDESRRYETYVRERITDLRTRKDVSEHRMSLELGKSGSYIRGITSGKALPSLRELFRIMAYLEVTPTEFFDGLDNPNSLRTKLREELMELNSEDLQKVSSILDWIRK